jgi:hypothetical protein
MFIIGLDPVLRGLWLSQLFNAWLGVSSAPMSEPTAGAPFLRQQRRFVLGSCDDGRLQQYNHLYLPSVMLLVYVLIMYCDIYQYK